MLQFYATGSFQWILGRSCAMTQSSVSLTIDSVTQTLVRYTPAFTNFTTGRPSIHQHKLAFHAVAGFLNVKSPSVNKEAYVNRKGVHMINIQAVCDSDMKVNNVARQHPRCVHLAFKHPVPYVWEGRRAGLRLISEGQLLVAIINIIWVNRQDISNNTRH